MKYRVVIANTNRNLEDKVNELIEDGWKPQGGITIDNFVLVQAMVKEE
jgi:hypothetical protein